MTDREASGEAPEPAAWAARTWSSRHFRADMALVAVTVIWGTTFPLMQAAVQEAPPYRFLFWRFGLAALVLTVLFWRQLRRTPRGQALAAAGIGLTLFVGYAAQIVGLQYTTAARSAFITALAVVLVPFGALIILRQRPTLGAWAGVGLAAIGLFLLSWPGWEGTNARLLRGDLITLICAVFYALQIVLVGKYAPRMEAMPLATIQLAVVAVLSGLLSLTEAPTLAVPGWLAANVLFLALAATALAFAVQSKAQRFTSSIHVALIFAMEPVFAAFFSWLFTGEVLTGRALLGCALILGGMLVAELRSA